MRKNFAMKKIVGQSLLLILMQLPLSLVLAGELLPAQARPAQSADLIKRARFESRPVDPAKACEGGYYSGPRQGRVRYTKDTFVWVVTPEFARRFCMPEQFVDATLKGAEAIAYRIEADPFEEICGWGGNKEVCGAARRARFEVYLKNNQAIPKLNDALYYSIASAPSTALISRSDYELNYLRDKVKKMPTPGATDVFESQQVALVLGNAKEVKRPISALYTQVYYKEFFNEHAFYAFYGLPGMMESALKVEKDARQFAIAIMRLNDPKNNVHRPWQDYAHVIYLPEKFANTILQWDSRPENNFAEFAKRALNRTP